MNVKENIIVKEKKDSYTYSFEFKLNGLTPTLTENGDIEIREDGEDEIKYLIPAPVVFDANGEHAPSTASAYTLTRGNGKKYILTVTVDSAWMNDEQRAFPVTVDPAVTTSSSSVIDVNIATSYPTTDSSNSTDITVMSGTTHTMIIHWKTTSLPTIPSSARICDAYIVMHKIGGSDYSTESYIGAYEVLTDWGSDLTWEKYTDSTNPQGKTLTNMVDYFYIEPIKAEFSWNVTPLLDEWYNGNNYGVAFAGVGDYYSSISFASNEYSDAAKKPALAVIYRDMKGMESYWPFSTHEVGMAGNGSVNLSNGNLVFTIPTLTTTDKLFSYTPTLVYDASMAGKEYSDSNSENGLPNSFLSLGFKLNTSEEIVAESYNGIENYIYSDADGTEHYIFSQADGVYRDEDGLGLILVKDIAGNISITNASKIVRTFDKVENADDTVWWRLSSITDADGNRLVFTFADNYKPTKISLLPNGHTVAIDLLEFYYNSNGHLKMVYNSSAKTAVVFRYSATYNGSISSASYQYLRQIDYAYGNPNVTMANWDSFALSSLYTTNITVYDTAKYEYDSSGRLIKAQNVNENTSVEYVYIQNKLTIIDKLCGELISNTVKYLFTSDYSRVRISGEDKLFDTVDDINTYYVLDNYGRCVNVYSTLQYGDASYTGASYAYDTQSNSKNSVKQSSNVTNSAINYIVNGSFEDKSGNKPAYWYTSGNVSLINRCFEAGSFDKSLRIRPAAGTSAYILQNLSLTSGKYTLSFPACFTDCEGVTGRIELKNYDDGITLFSEPISEILDSGEVMITTSFDITTYYTYRNVELSINFESPTGITNIPDIEIDSVMLSKTFNVEKYNLVEYGSFEYTLTETLFGAYPMITTNHWKNQDGNSVSIIDGGENKGNVASLQNSSGGVKYIKQTVYSASASKLADCDTNGASEEDNLEHTFTVSGFAKSQNAIPGKPFCLKAEIVYYRGSDHDDISSVYTYDFLSDNDEWQFTGGAFTIGYDQDGNSVGDYLCIKSISIYCDVSDHYGVYALFNDISIVYGGIRAVTNYTYDSDGRVTSITCGNDGEFYQYNAYGVVLRKANNNGELIVYDHDLENLHRVTGLTYYNYTYEGSTAFPYYLDDPFNAIQSSLSNLKPKTKTEYLYNDYGMVVSDGTYEIPSSGVIDYSVKGIVNSYTYDLGADSKVFGALLTETNTRGYTTRYFYDENTGNLLACVNTTSEIGTSYVYDGAGRLTGVYPATYQASTGTQAAVTNGEKVLYTYNAQNRLSGITTDSTTYTLLYDDYGNQSAIKVGNTSIVSYEYENNNGKLSKVTYANGQIVRYVYNDLAFVTEIWYNDDTEPTYEYRYTADGRLYLIVDNETSTITTFKYDANGKLVESKEYDGQTYAEEFSKEITYDEEDRISKVEQFWQYPLISGEASVQTRQHYLYSDDGRFNFKSFYSGLTYAGIGYTYDDYDRVTTIESEFYNGANQSYDNRVELTYHENASSTSYLVNEYANYVNNERTNYYYYWYDCNDNIFSISSSAKEYMRYNYDSLGQLTSEYRKDDGYTMIYSYDDAGNITCKTNVYVYENGLDSYIGSISYGYTNSEWGDLLTRYDGVTLTYDALGNPLGYYNGEYYSFSWDGRTMLSAENHTTRFDFTYYENGMRKSKTDVQDIMNYEFVYDGTTLIMETFVDLYSILYIYDDKGAPIGFKYRGVNYAYDVWDVYWYEKNLQGDIVAVYSAAGTKLISYEYDAWGNFTTTYHNNGSSSTAKYNKYTYRGYYYDPDLKMYYLQSRYYDPATCRFISPDSIIPSINSSLQGFNLYSYCFNNPINYTDTSGEWPEYIETAVKIGSAVVAIGAVVVMVSTISALSAGTATPAALIGATVFLSVALTGINGGIANSSKGNSYLNGYVGGAVGGGIQAAFSKSAIGTIIGGGIGVTIGTAITDLLNNLDPYSVTSTAQEIVSNAVVSGLKATATSTITAFIGYASDMAVTDASELMPTYTFGFGEAVKAFFSWMDDALVYIMG